MNDPWGGNSNKAQYISFVSFEQQHAAFPGPKGAKVAKLVSVAKSIRISSCKLENVELYQIACLGTCKWVFWQSLVQVHLLTFLEEFQTLIF